MILEERTPLDFKLWSHSIPLQNFTNMTGVYNILLIIISIAEKLKKIN